MITKTPTKATEQVALKELDKIIVSKDDLQDRENEHAVFLCFRDSGGTAKIRYLNDNAISEVKINDIKKLK